MAAKLQRHYDGLKVELDKPNGKLATLLELTPSLRECVDERRVQHSLARTAIQFYWPSTTNVLERDLAL
jgi:hypothetical protein